MKVELERMKRFCLFPVDFFRNYENIQQELIGLRRISNRNSKEIMDKLFVSTIYLIQ